MVKSHAVLISSCIIAARITPPKISLAKSKHKSPSFSKTKFVLKSLYPFIKAKIYVFPEPIAHRTKVLLSGIPRLPLTFCTPEKQAVRKPERREKAKGCTCLLSCHSEFDNNRPPFREKRAGNAGFPASFSQLFHPNTDFSVRI
mgnify:CR=1 FL=1